MASHAFALCTAITGLLVETYLSGTSNFEGIENNESRWLDS